MADVEPVPAPEADRRRRARRPRRAGALRRRPAASPRSPRLAGDWPKFLAIAIVARSVAARRLARWQPEYVLPAPADVFDRSGERPRDGRLWHAVAITLRRGITGFALAIVIGVALGSLVARSGSSAPRSAR